MVKPTDGEMTVIEKTIFYTHRSQEKGTHHTMVGPHRETPDQSGVGACGQEPLLQFPWKDQLKKQIRICSFE